MRSQVERSIWIRSELTAESNLNVAVEQAISDLEVEHG